MTESGRDRFDLSELDQVDETHAGVKMGILDRPIVDREHSNVELSRRLEPVSPRDLAVIFEHATRVQCTSRHGLDGDLFRIGFHPDFCGTVCSLWVDRDPYLMDVCNGGIYAVDPDEVRVRREVVA